LLLVEPLDEEDDEPELDDEPVDEDGPLDADEPLDWLLEFEAELEEYGMEDELLDDIAPLDEAELDGVLEDEPDELEDADALAELEAGGWTPMCVRCGLRRLCGWRSCRFRSGFRSTRAALFCRLRFIAGQLSAFSSQLSACGALRASLLIADG
jgi:hypothetical protein